MDLNESIQFYQSIAKSKDDLVKSENKRLELEKVFIHSLKSDRTLVKLRASKLQDYYKKLCDNERLSSIRNQQILGDMARAENRLQHLEAKLERLGALKQECQNYIQTNYPNWQQILNQTIVDKPLHVDTTPHVTLSNNIINLLKHSPTESQAKKTQQQRQPSVLDSLVFNVQSPNNDNLVEEYKNELQKAENPNVSIADSILSGVAIKQKQVPSWTRTAEVRNFEEKHKLNQNESDNSSHDDNFRRKNSSLRKELNINALYHLLDYIESDMNNTIHKDKYYRTEQPHYKEKLEIISLARELKNLDDIDSGNVSMVVLSQLKSVIAKHTKNGCLFTDEILSFSVTDMNEQVVYSHLRDDKDRHLWKRLVSHWCCLKKFGVSDASTLASLFAPCLIKHENYGELKAKQFIEKIINTSSQFDDEQDFELDPKTPRTEPTTSFNELLHSPTQLAESNTYQEFIKKASLERKPTLLSDEDDESIDQQIIPNKQSITKLQILSPRKDDYSQSSISEQKSDRVNQMMLLSQRSNKTPTYLKKFDEMDSDEDSKSHSQKHQQFLSRGKSNASDADHDFYS